MSNNYYDILSLHPRHRVETLSQRDLKAAYRQALLRFHPDKDSSSSSHVSTPERSPSKTAVTVDDITKAYKTLSDPKRRAGYDQQLSKQDGSTANPPYGRIHHTGLETVDLDSLAFDEQTQTWSRSCRCGDNKGFIVTESELEKHAEHGELMVGCKGCSLWLRVLFSVEEDG